MRTIPTLFSSGLLILLTVAALLPVVAAPANNTPAKIVAAAQPDGEGRVLLPAFPVDSVVVDRTGATLSMTAKSYPFRVYKADPSVRDTVAVHLTPDVVAKLNQQGIKDLSAHFKGKTLHVRGKRTQIFYFCFPAIVAYTLTVDRLDDLRLTGAAAPVLKAAFSSFAIPD